MVIKNASSVFQRSANKIFADLIGEIFF